MDVLSEVMEISLSINPATTKFFLGMSMEDPEEVMG